MPNYIVNTNAQPRGEHEVHETSPKACGHLPDPGNRKDLGWHTSCHEAVKEAKKHYDNIDGCYYCCNDCHTR